MKTTHQNLLLTILGALLVGTSACNAPGDDALPVDVTDAGLRCPSSAGALDEPAQPLLGRVDLTQQPAAPASETFECSCAERSVTYDTSPIELHANYRRCKTENDACPVSERVVGRLATALTAEGLHIDEAAHTRQTDVCSPGASPEELPHCTTNVTKTGYVEVAGNTSADFAGVVATCMRAGGIQAWNDAFDVAPDGPDWHAEPWGAASYCILFSMYRLAGYAAPDTDSDGVCNREDNCVGAADPNQLDADGDGVGDACDDDRDGDGVQNGSDNCPDLVNSSQADSDDDGQGDKCDASVDRDQDGLADTSDNCVFDSNADQADSDGDGFGDACDLCPTEAQALDLGDTDLDGLGDACDPDMDGDSVANVSDVCPKTADPDQQDADTDGVGNACDNCPSVPNVDQADADENGVGDACQLAGSVQVQTTWRFFRGAPLEFIDRIGGLDAMRTLVPAPRTMTYGDPFHGNVVRTAPLARPNWAISGTDVLARAAQCGIYPYGPEEMPLPSAVAARYRANMNKWFLLDEGSRVFAVVDINGNDIRWLQVSRMSTGPEDPGDPEKFSIQAAAPVADLGYFLSAFNCVGAP